MGVKGMVENNRNDYDDNGHGISFPLLETLISVQCILINHQNKSLAEVLSHIFCTDEDNRVQRK